MEASGPLSGLLYRHGTYGPIVSRSSSAPALRTVAQSEARATFHNASAAWAALDDRIKAAWQNIAGPLETGRSLYVAAYCRLYPTGDMPDGPPQDTIGADVLDNPTALYTPQDPPVMETWTYTTAANIMIIRIFAYGSWSNRSYPKPSKMRLIGTTYSDTPYGIWNLPYKAPVWFVRFEATDAGTGRVLEKILVKATTAEPQPEP